MSKRIYSNNPEDWKLKYTCCGNDAIYKAQPSYAKAVRKLKRTGNLNCRSCYWKNLYKSDPYELTRRHDKMIKTKRQQSKDGTLSNQHFTKKKTKSEIKHIYSQIGQKSSETKRKKFDSGELIQWNTGLTKHTDDRVVNYSGKNHYRWNDDMQRDYPPTFHNKGYREYLLNRQCGVCLVDGTNNDLVLHHVDEDKNNSHETNLIYVERKIHMKIHNNREYQENFNKQVIKFLSDKILIIN